MKIHFVAVPRPIHVLVLAICTGQGRTKRKSIEASFASNSFLALVTCISQKGGIIGSTAVLSGFGNLKFLGNSNLDLNEMHFFLAGVTSISPNWFQIKMWLFIQPLIVFCLLTTLHKI